MDRIAQLPKDGEFHAVGILFDLTPGISFASPNNEQFLLFAPGNSVRPSELPSGSTSGSERLSATSLKIHGYRHGDISPITYRYLRVSYFHQLVRAISFWYSKPPCGVSYEILRLGLLRGWRSSTPPLATYAPIVTEPQLPLLELDEIFRWRLNVPTLNGFVRVLACCRTDDTCSRAYFLPLH